MARSVRALEFDPEAHCGRRNWLLEVVPWPPYMHCDMILIPSFFWLEDYLTAVVVGLGLSLKAMGGEATWSSRTQSLAEVADRLHIARQVQSVPWDCLQGCTKVSLTLTWTDSAAGIGHVLCEFRWPFLHHLQHVILCEKAWLWVSKFQSIVKVDPFLGLELA